MMPLGGYRRKLAVEQTEPEIGLHLNTTNTNTNTLVLVLILILGTISIMLSSTVPAICESSVWVIWTKVVQHQVAANSYICSLDSN